LSRTSVTWKTSSAEETIDLGRRLGERLGPGDVAALCGDLGSGKTWFTKGLALGLGVSPDEVVTSPSFALMNAYEGRWSLFHMDVYRLERVSEFLDAGLDDYLYGDGVTVIEWADRWPEILPERHLKVRFVVLDEHSREITFSGGHPEAIKIIGEMKES
jgi:tRNA threonylcarbamoyladenosine biosynthesis protein TsaE